MAKKGCLYLIPSSLGMVDNISSILPQSAFTIIPLLQGFIIENGKKARSFLKNFPLTKPLYEISMKEIEKNAGEELLKPLLKGEQWGLLSDAGCPAVADPGASLIRLAHTYGIRVIPLVGPSSIFLALMASGLNGQSFVFHGYLSQKRPERIRKLKELERNAFLHRQTQIFMETPYRNTDLLADIIRVLDKKTELCVATDLTLVTEQVITKTIAEFRAQGLPDIHKRPTIFLMGK